MRRVLRFKEGSGLGAQSICTVLGQGIYACPLFASPLGGVFCSFLVTVGIFRRERIRVPGSGLSVGVGAGFKCNDVACVGTVIRQSKGELLSFSGSGFFILGGDDIVALSIRRCT